MMDFDFDILTDRLGTASLKWDVKDGELPMWVADMDFPTAPSVRAAIERRAAHGIYGYTLVTDEWYDAYINWWSSRHGLNMEKDRLIFTTGVIPALSTAVRKFTTPAERIVVLSPVYNIFYNSIINNGRRVAECPLVYKDGEYSVDFEELEKKFADPLTTMIILCNPHNPVGKIWDEATLKEIGELAVRNNVLVFSDEIHCDITAPGKKYVPFASVSEDCRRNSITAIAPTKAFNIAGINTAAVYVPDKGLYNRMNRALNTDEVAEPNAFAVDAAVAAFSKEGESWLEALCGYIEDNKSVVYKFTENELTGVKAVKQDATYLMWLDVSAHTEDAASNVLQKRIREKTGLYLSAGKGFGTGGENFLRMNVACPRSVLMDGLKRLLDFF